jgi:translation initiation factor 2B subunit (eIF-2B alpha/beta/delta family)
VGDEVEVELVRCDSDQADENRICLFNIEERTLGRNNHDVEYRWVRPTRLPELDAESNLWKTYQRVQPTVETIRDEVEYGSAYLSIRALEVLRDRAGAPETTPTDWDSLLSLASEIRDAQPTMSVIHNRISRAFDAADEQTPEALEQAAHDIVQPAENADAAAAEDAVELIDNETVFTVSRSGTVLSVLENGDPDEIYVTVSETDREGISAAALLDQYEMTLITDAATAHVLAKRDIDILLVGADSILPDGSIVNKIGTRNAALAAVHEDIPVYSVAAADKIQTEQTLHQDNRSETDVYEGDADIDALNQVFDVVPTDLLDGIVTEDGILSSEEIRSRADRLQRHSDDYR